MFLDVYGRVYINNIFIYIYIYQYTSFKSSSFLMVQEFQVGTQLNKNIIGWLAKHA